MDSARQALGETGMELGMDISDVRKRYGNGKGSGLVGLV